MTEQRLVSNDSWDRAGACIMRLFYADVGV